MAQDEFLEDDLDHACIGNRQGVRERSGYPYQSGGQDNAQVRIYRPYTGGEQGFSDGG